MRRVLVDLLPLVVVNVTPLFVLDEDNTKRAPNPAAAKIPYLLHDDDADDEDVSKPLSSRRNALLADVDDEASNKGAASSALVVA